MLNFHWSAPARLEVSIPEAAVPKDGKDLCCAAISPHMFHEASLEERRSGELRGPYGVGSAVEHPPYHRITSHEVVNRVSSVDNVKCLSACGKIPRRSKSFLD